MVLHNMVLLGFTAGLYLGVKTVNLDVTLGFPHIALALGFFVYQGTVSLSYRTLFTSKSFLEIPIALVALLIVGYGFPYVTWKWITHRGAPEVTDQQREAGHRTRARWHPNGLTVWFSPQGIWIPAVGEIRNFGENIYVTFVIVCSYLLVLGTKRKKKTQTKQVF